MRLRVLIVLVAIAGVFAPSARAAEVADLVYVEQGQMFVVGGDGTGRRELPASNPWELSRAPWSPDGLFVVYVPAPDLSDWIGMPVYSMELRVVRSDGRSDRRLLALQLCCQTWPVSPVGGWVSHAAWAPDGKRIAFNLSGGACPLWYTCGGTRTLWVVRKDGSDLRLLAADVAGDETSWSPDGREIAFAREGAIEVARVEAPGTYRRVSPIESRASQPAWSPDGRRIAFVGSSVADPLRFGGAVWVADADGANARRLAADTWDTPSWSPDSRWIAYSDRGIGVIRHDGRARRTLTAVGPREEEWSPRWTPGGTRIAFMRDDGREAALWTISLRGGSMHRVVWFPSSAAMGGFAGSPARGR